MAERTNTPVRSKMKISAFGCAIAALRCVWTGVLLVLVVVAGLSARLAYGPMRIDALAPMLEARLSEASDDFDVTLQSASLFWNVQGRSMGVTLQEVELIDLDGRRIGGAPQLQVGFDLPSAISGVAALTRIELTGADALLIRTQEGRFRFALFAPESEQEAAAPPADQMDDPSAFEAARAFIDKLSHGADPALAHFSSFIVNDLHLRYQDDMGGVRWLAPAANLQITREDDGILGVLEGDVQIDDGAPLRLRLEGAKHGFAEEAVVELAARFDNAPAKALASQTPALAELSRLDGALSGALSGKLLLSDGSLEALRVRISTQNAVLRASTTEHLMLKRAAAAFAFDPARETIQLERLDLAVSGLEAIASGEADIIRDENGTPIALAGQTRLHGAQLASPRLFAEPLQVGGGDMAFRLELDPMRLHVSRFFARTPDVEISGDAQIEVADGEPTAKFTAQFSNFNAARMGALWPIPAAAGARDWVTQHIHSGMVEGLKITGDASDATADQIQVSFRFSDLQSAYLNDMTPISGARGWAKMNLDAFEIEIEEGQVDLGEGVGALEVGGSKTKILLDRETELAQIDIAAAGPLRAALTLIDEEPLGFISKLGLDPKSVKGATQLNASLSFPLLKDLALDDIQVSTAATGENVSLIAPGINKRVTSRSIELKADAESLSASGLARIDGLLAHVRWREVFSPKRGGARSRFNLSKVFKAEALHEMGAPEHAVTGGSTATRIAITLKDGAPATFDLNADLQKLEVSLPSLGWRKQIGEEGELIASGVITADKIAADSLRAESGALYLHGDALFSSGLEFQRLRVAKIVIGEETELSAEVAREDTGGWRIMATGPRLDLRSQIQDVAEGQTGPETAAPSSAAEGEATPISLDLRVSRAKISDITALHDLALFAHQDAQGHQTADITAQVGGQGPLSAKYRAGDGGKALTARSRNAGELLRSLGAFRDGSGGELALDVTLNAKGKARGRLEVTDLVIKDAPVLAQILSIGSLVGLVDALQSGGISFSQISAPFSFKDGVLDIDEAVAVGPSIGLTLDGVYDRKRDALEFSGSVSPAFVLNGLLSGVPLIGDVLTGGEGRGLIGVAYQISGGAADPKVFVNPLSALAIGPFRKIFEGAPDPDAPNILERNRDRFER